MSWARGRDRIVEVLAAGELELVTPDVGAAHRLLHDALRHIESASAATHLEDSAVAINLPTMPCASRQQRCWQLGGCEQRVGAATWPSKRQCRHSSADPDRPSDPSREYDGIATPLSTRTGTASLPMWTM